MIRSTYYVAINAFGPNVGTLRLRRAVNIDITLKICYRTR